MTTKQAPKNTTSTTISVGSEQACRDILNRLEPCRGQRRCETHDLPILKSGSCEEGAPKMVFQFTETQSSISTWAEETFGRGGSNARVAARALNEMSELMTHLTSDDNHPRAREEIADIAICLFRLSDRMKGNLLRDVDLKMAINRKREWTLDGTGCGQHKVAFSSKSGLSFDDAWKLMEQRGYQYGVDALERVHYGWKLAALRENQGLSFIQAWQKTENEFGPLELNQVRMGWVMWNDASLGIIKSP